MAYFENEKFLEILDNAKKEKLIDDRIRAFLKEFARTLNFEVGGSCWNCWYKLLDDTRYYQEANKYKSNAFGDYELYFDVKIENNEYGDYSTLWNQKYNFCIAIGIKNKPGLLEFTYEVISHLR
jgi:hypothetical protein